MTLAALGIIILVRMKDSHLPRRHLHKCWVILLEHVRQVSVQGRLAVDMRRQQASRGIALNQGAVV